MALDAVEAKRARRATGPTEANSVAWRANQWLMLLHWTIEQPSRSIPGEKAIRYARMAGR